MNTFDRRLQRLEREQASQRACRELRVVFVDEDAFGNCVGAGDGGRVIDLEFDPAREAEQRRLYELHTTWRPDHHAP